MKGPASRMPNESSDYRLLVEGSSDQHAIIHLMKRHDYKWEDGSTQRPYVQSYDGLPNLPRAITAAKAKSRLGIVVDADESPAARWQELTRWLAPIVQRVPSEPAKEGLVLEGVVPDTWVGFAVFYSLTWVLHIYSVGCTFIPSAHKTTAIYTARIAVPSQSLPSRPKLKKRPSSARRPHGHASDQQPASGREGEAIL